MTSAAMAGLGGIVSEMQAIGAAIRQARDAVNAGGMVDIGPLGPRVNQLCDRLAGLPAGEGAALRPGILALIDDFNRLAGVIGTRLDALRTDLKRAGGPAPTPAAHPQAARPDETKR